jgi:opacity protein-like surface antigen
MKKLIIILMSIFIIACGTAPQLNDDAVDIRYEKYKEDLEENDSLLLQFDPNIAPGTEKLRNPSTLRGNIYHIAEIQKKDENDSIITETFAVFLDSIHFGKDEDKIEYIPLEYLILPEIPNSDSGSYWVAQWNTPELHGQVRELDVKQINISNCGCKDPSFPSLNASISCPFVWEKRLDGRSRIFAEANGGVSIYDNFSQGLRKNIGEEDLTGEFVIGYRFGDYTKAHFGLGLSYFTGINQFSRSSRENINRDVLMLHGKYTFDIIHKYVCMFPYIYGQFGMALDVNSLYVGRLGFSQNIDGFLGIDCDCELEGEADLDYRQNLVLESPEADFNIPISFGFGAGVEMSVWKYLDLSIDLNYKYVQYGERISLFGLDAPRISDISVVSLRLGLHY